jgi:hypothetical protein
MHRRNLDILRLAVYQGDPVTGPFSQDRLVGRLHSPTPKSDSIG